MQTTTQSMQGTVPAKLVRCEGNFCLVSYHLIKNVSREEGLKIKNEFKMKSYSFGYEGVVPMSLFKGGEKTVD